MLAKFVIVFILLSVLSFTCLAQPLENRSGCPQICPDNYDPICATDGNSFLEFPNSCEMDAHNCQLLSDSKQAFETTLDLDMCR
ncbi:enhancer of split M1 protein [Musca domestica]|uniref:Enhancer of split M1 protein n=1 Tax=Musca domestica TaxID=7370 RepID=A0A9J7DK18_MUSDO|nr:enhancer of split M1 protein [Musca domestica]